MKRENMYRDWKGISYRNVFYAKLNNLFRVCKCIERKTGYKWMLITQNLVKNGLSSN
ncbi:hypothetical protein NBO_26g0006 [Nosema bombycis CQ1]|uniref:Uncharacterized protein n=1 Tax=Nosema bombycis (strain CQ1 / CVCC 102059) TaxID=578461 RepID=R0KUJ6_NOSB1|nr:hypothetical protein NBO_26g0006 [Nosema bombycis CQ1]|eukprot:EOB14521.1 hypothetical protein NBO_26g0006 [Nosema bombycis CQ1]